MSCEQRRALTALVRCRTAALGGHVDQCSECDYRRPSYNSCRNRHCPKCQALAQHRWLQKRRERILPVHHFHVVFTLPAELRPLLKRNPRTLYEVMFKSASATLLELGADTRRLGARLGVSAVLHTWSRDLGYHPHIHCVVTGGGLSLDGAQWVATRPGYLFPVRVMAALFRGKFLSSVQSLHDGGKLEVESSLDLRQLLGKLAGKCWVAYCKRPFGDADAVYAYLGRYTHRVGISNRRLLHVDDHNVRFRTQHEKQVTLNPVEFLRRWTLHVLPRGFVRIRHYGLLAPGNIHTRLAKAAALLKPVPNEMPASPPVKGEQDDRPEYVCDYLELTGVDLRACPACRNGRLAPLPLEYERGPP